MSKIGGWWLSSFRLDANESLQEKYPTNYFRGEDRPYGGRLYMTDRRFIFLPHRIDAILGAGHESIPFETINDVSSEEDFLDESTLEERRIPPRIRIETLDGQHHFFVVEDLESTLETMQKALGILEDEADGSDDAPENR